MTLARQSNVLGVILLCMHQIFMIRYSDRFLAIVFKFKSALSIGTPKPGSSLEC